MKKPVKSKHNSYQINITIFIFAKIKSKLLSVKNNIDTIIISNKLLTYYIFTNYTQK